MREVGEQQWIESLKKLSSGRRFFAMYSTLWDGIVTSPAHMMIPIDEHMVHRGDGIFEAIRVRDKKPYLLRPHLERLHRSAEALSFKVPVEMDALDSLCRKLAGYVTTPDGILRLFVGRGPGDFSVNPYATIGNQLYAVAVAFTPPQQAVYDKGASVMISSVPFKPSPYATIKSCNYLFNVMMKKESVDAGYDYCVGLNGHGRIAEGPTENIMILDNASCLRAPKFDYTLRGTTLVRVMELAQSLRHAVAGNVPDASNGTTITIKDIVIDDITVEDLAGAREAMMVGTAIGAMPVVKFQDKPIGTGKPGPVARELHRLFVRDLRAEG